jgi:hypothetical protein
MTSYITLLISYTNLFLRLLHRLGFRIGRFSEGEHMANVSPKVAFGLPNQRRGGGLEAKTPVFPDGGVKTEVWSPLDEPWWVNQSSIPDTFSVCITTETPTTD